MKKNIIILTLLNLNIFFFCINYKSESDIKEICKNASETSYNKCIECNENCSDTCLVLESYPEQYSCQD